MTFFPADSESSESPEPGVPERPRWWGPPDDELPALLPAREVLGTTEHAAVALIGAFVHSDGVGLLLERRLRRGDLPRRKWQRLLTDFAEHGMFGEPEDPATRLRFGVVLGDGEQVLDSRSFDAEVDPIATPDRHLLTRTGGNGGGGDHAYSSSETLWLWPLPPPGPIELVMQWPALGMGEARAVLDGGRIRELAQQVVPLWVD